MAGYASNINQDITQISMGLAGNASNINQDTAQIRIWLTGYASGYCWHLKKDLIDLSAISNTK